MMFTVGQQAIWTGSAGLFRRAVTIAAVRNSYLVIMGESPEDGRTVYDITDPVIGGLVFGIPASQLQPDDPLDLDDAEAQRIAEVFADARAELDRGL